MCRTDTAVEYKLNCSQVSGSDREIKKALDINFPHVDRFKQYNIYGHRSFQRFNYNNMRIKLMYYYVTVNDRRGKGTNEMRGG